LDSRFKIQGSYFFQSNLFGFKIQGWRPSDSRSFLGILNLESYPLWIQEVFLESWILNLESDVLREGRDGNKLATFCNFWLPKNAPSLRVQNVKKNTVNTTKFVWKADLGRVPYIHIYVYISNCIKHHHFSVISLIIWLCGNL